jgi:hypothetical protein
VLAARHNSVAADLGDVAEGEAIRAMVDRHLESELGAALAAEKAT